MAEISSLWQQFQEQQKRDARRIAARVVRDAVIRFNPPCDDREPFYRLHKYTGLDIPGGPTNYQTALHEKLVEVCD